MHRDNEVPAPRVRGVGMIMIPMLASGKKML